MHSLAAGSARSRMVAAVKRFALLISLALTCALALAGAAYAVGGLASVPGLSGGQERKLARMPVEPSRYDVAKRCYRKPTRGATALAEYLTRTRPRGSSWGIMRCERLSKRSMSLHSEGRALDWHLDAGSAADRREARRLYKMLLATRDGEPQALARRMGVQELIWNCTYWGAGMDRPGRYNLCFTESGKRRKRVNKTAAHRDHIHIGITKAAARKRTSFWRVWR